MLVTKDALLICPGNVLEFQSLRIENAKNSDCISGAQLCNCLSESLLHSKLFGSLTYIIFHNS